VVITVDIVAETTAITTTNVEISIMVIVIKEIGATTATTTDRTTMVTVIVAVSTTATPTVVITLAGGLADKQNPNNESVPATVR
jgi:hypothetical protein